MTVPQIVIDTNVLISGTRSSKGAAFRLLQLVGSNRFDIHLSVPLVLEYQDVLSRSSMTLPHAPADVEKLIAFHCFIATHHRIFFLWRSFLPDPKDDMVLELAVKASCDFIVTYNSRDFRGVEKFGVKIATPAEFLNVIGIER
ncbi:MAG: putative toxin-antitoxin system toxin component, PIN family [Cyanobacteria bacterium P01_C01_bin.69]